MELKEEKGKTFIYMRSTSNVLHRGCGTAPLIICTAHVCLRAHMTEALSVAAGVVSHIFKYPSVRRVRRNSALTSLPFLSRGGRGGREKVTAGTKQRKIFFFLETWKQKETDASSTALWKRRREEQVGNEAAGQGD